MPQDLPSWDMLSASVTGTLAAFAASRPHEPVAPARDPPGDRIAADASLAEFKRAFPMYLEKLLKESLRILA